MIWVLIVFLVVVLAVFLKLSSLKFGGRALLPLKYRVFFSVFVPVFFIILFVFLGLVFIFVFGLVVVGFLMWLFLRIKRFK